MYKLQSSSNHELKFFLMHDQFAKNCHFQNQSTLILLHTCKSIVYFYLIGSILSVQELLSQFVFLCLGFQDYVVIKLTLRNFLAIEMQIDFRFGKRDFLFQIFLLGPSKCLSNVLRLFVYWCLLF